MHKLLNPDCNNCKDKEDLLVLHKRVTANVLSQREKCEARATALQEELIELKLAYAECSRQKNDLLTKLKTGDRR